MKTQAIKALILCTSIAGALVTVANAQNPNVTWQTPTLVSGTSDVSTLGTYFGSWAPFNGNANLTPINGVTFQGYPDLPNFGSSGFSGDYDSYANPNTPDAQYNALLQYGVYDASGSGSGDTITWGGMTPGHSYLIQFWANDGRGTSRSETLIGGANTSATIPFGNAALFILGTFVADNTGFETITLDGSASANGDYPQVNLLQVRDITVPEPWTVAVLAPGIGAVLLGLRRRQTRRS